MADRREHLRNYIIGVINDGELRGITRTPAALAKLARVFYADAGAVLAELGTIAADNFTDRITEKGKQVFGDILKDARKRGLAAIWDDLSSAYQRGLDVKHGPKRK